MDGDSCRQIQEDEKLAIQSIFDKDAVFEVNAWKLWKPLSVVIHLEPMESASLAGRKTNFVFLDLVVNCPATYPNAVPSLSCDVMKGISNEDKRVLFEKLESKSRELLGSPMILELCEVVRLFLYEKNTPTAGSFHDTMLKKKAAEESELRRQRAFSEKRELEQVVEERDRHVIEAQWKKETEGGEVNKLNVKNADVRVIAGYRITVNKEAPPKRTRLHAFCTEWMGVCNNEDILVSEWTFRYTQGRHRNPKITPSFDAFLSKCDEVEGMLARYPDLVGLDQTLVPYLFAKVIREACTPTNMSIKIMIGQKVNLAEESMTSTLVREAMQNDSNLIRRLSAHLVCALRSLHEQQLYHGNVTSQCVWMVDSSFRISDAGTLPLLRSLCDCFQQATSGHEVSTSVENVEKSSRKKDLFALGTLLDELKIGMASAESSSASVSNDELTDFILRCQSAKAAEDLLNHPYLILDLVPSGSNSGHLGIRSEADGRGRLVNEFLVLKWLGKGGFGDVILAKNKLDGNDYAVKRIPLNPKSEKLNRRITREAKLFSKLNHPNVVRYYSAWIEDASRQKDKERRNSQEKLAKGSPPSDKKKKSEREEMGTDSLLPTRLRNLELAAGPNGHNMGGDTSEWSTSYRKGVHISIDSSSDEESSRGLVQTIFSPRNNRNDDEFEILFEASGSIVPESDPVTETEASGTSQPETTETGPTGTTSTTAVTEKQGDEDESPTRLLYIQMEYCEKSTLRRLIDSKSLVGNGRMIWRIFGEILAGLLYIHRLGMIHRDIKPMNILLDGGDHVKIGDFGLATRDLLLKKDSVAANPDAKVSGQTRDIGTELYMAPELFVLDDTHPYTSKIDVYSTGIILFEMFYRPLPPGMERISTIKNLKKTVAMPPDFGSQFSSVQSSLARSLIEWMLRENADERPTVEELVSDDRIPIADIEDENFQGIFLRTIKKRTGRLYHWMIDALFKERPSAALNYCFDQDICADKYKCYREDEIEDARSLISSICRLHSFSPLQTHTLTPLSEGTSTKRMTVMDTSGYTCALPVDLRKNFVRYCCRNAVHRLKRYTFDKIFSKNDAVGGVHPSERLECCIDSIGPCSASLTLSTEILSIVGEIAETTLQGLKCTLRIGHMEVVECAMRHLAIPVETRISVLEALHQIYTSSKISSGAEKLDVLSELLGEKLASSLVSFLPSESSILILKESCRALTRSRDEYVRERVRNALSELEKISQLLTADGDFGPEILFDMSLTYRPATFRDGLVFALSVEVPRKAKNVNFIVLAGGRYDSSLSAERHPHDLSPSSPLCLVGCTMSMDLLAHIRKCIRNVPSSYGSAVVCSYSSDLLVDKFRLARQLWNRGIPTDVLHEAVDSLDSLIEHCEEHGILHILVVFGRDEVLLRSRDNDHGKMSFDDAIAMVSMTLDSDDEEGVSILTVNTPLSAARTAQATFSNCNIVFALATRPAFNTKKRIENQVQNVLSDVVSLFSSKGRIDIVVTELSTELLRTIAAAMSRNMTQEELKLLFDGLSRQHGKSKEDLECVFGALATIYSPRQPTVPLIILFRHLDGGYYRAIV